jgi:HEAT repeat protein
MHKHQCSLCETVWHHGEEYNDDIWAHECPACGCHQFRVFRDADPVIPHPAGEAPLAVADPVAALAAAEGLARARAAFSLDVRTAPAQQLVPQLAEWVTRDPYPLVRLAAIEALRRFGAPARTATPAITAALSDPQAYVRRAAALALGSFGPAAEVARFQLTRRLEDGNPAVRAAAAAALKNIGQDGFSPVTEVWVVP